MKTMDKNETELCLLRQLETLIREGIYDPPQSLEGHAAVVHSLLGDLDHVRRDDEEAAGTTYMVLTPGSSALIVGPEKEMSWVLANDPYSMSAAWVTIAASAIDNTEVVEELKAELFGVVEA